MAYILLKKKLFYLGFMCILSCSSYAQKPILYYWLSTSCPLCIKYTLTIRKLQSQYETNVQTVLVFPSDKKKKIRRFLLNYQLNTPYIIDQNHDLTRQYQIKVTPEALLCSGAQIPFYRGAIDDRVKKLGQWRDSINTFYLRNAIEELIHRKKCSISQTEAVGCIIESPSF